MGVDHQRGRKSGSLSLAESTAQSRLITSFQGDLGAAAVGTPVGPGTIGGVIERREQRIGVGMTGLCRELAGGHLEVGADNGVEIEVIGFAGARRGREVDGNDRSVSGDVCLFGSAGDPYMANATRT